MPKNTVSAVGARLLLWPQQQNLLDVSRETGRSKPEDVVLMVTASYGGEALKVSC